MNYNYNKFKFNSLGGKIMENINILDEIESNDMNLSEEKKKNIEIEESTVDVEEIKGLKAFWI
jgi:hypothetical protein